MNEQGRPVVEVAVAVQRYRVESLVLAMLLILYFLAGTAEMARYCGARPVGEGKKVRESQPVGRRVF